MTDTNATLERAAGDPPGRGLDACPERSSPGDFSFWYGEKQALFDMNADDSPRGR